MVLRKEHDASNGGHRHRRRFARRGGAVVFGILNNCVLSGNWTPGGGGGANDCTLNSCLITGNSAIRGGAR